MNRNADKEFKRPNQLEPGLLGFFGQTRLSLVDRASGQDFSASESILSCAVVIIRFRSVGYLPVIIDEGRVNVDILEYLQFLKEQEKSDSTLILRATALRRFLDFYKWALPNASERPIVRAFFDSLVHGHRDLGWESVSLKTARRYVEAIALFLDYFCDAHGIASPNPRIEEPRNWASIIWERIRRYRSDPLYHLFDMTKRSKVRRRRLYLPAPKVFTATSSHVRKKTFELEEFIKLIEFESNPRNRLIWLLLGGGGLRESEVIHLFTSDITYDEAILQASVLLAHPTYGTIKVEGRRLTRQAYLKERFGLVPRDQLPMYDLLQAGWKGMKFQKGDTAGVTWLHPSFGVSAWQAHFEYLPLRCAANAAHHPWHFVNFKHNVGEPLTRRNLYQQLHAACKRLELRSPSNPHALRHMYVHTIVNILGMPVEDAQILVRHSDLASTAEYSRASTELTRKSLEILRNQPSIPYLDQRGRNEQAR
jgi:integrase